MNEINDIPAFIKITFYLRGLKKANIELRYEYQMVEVQELGRKNTEETEGMAR